jgi:hypothetical protein
MSTDEKKDFLNSLAKILSIIFHPLLMLFYGLAIIFTAPTLFGYLPVEVIYSCQYHYYLFLFTGRLSVPGLSLKEKKGQCLLS